MPFKRLTDALSHSSDAIEQYVSILLYVAAKELVKSGRTRFGSWGCASSIGSRDIVHGSGLGLKPTEAGDIFLWMNAGERGFL